MYFEYDKCLCSM